MAIIIGTNGNDSLIGGAGDDELYGHAGIDKLVGGDGDDHLDGGPGKDYLFGERGDDTYVVDRDDVLAERANEGTDTVWTPFDYTLPDNFENLSLTGQNAVDGTGNSLDNVIIGNVADNTLRGLEGNDTLRGGGGNDRLIGGAGDDTYKIDNGDTVLENVDGGTDTVEIADSHTLADNVENLVLLGNQNFHGIGNELHNEITGNSASNTLRGEDGADRLKGEAGNDRLIGGSGRDDLLGGDGNDVLSGGSGSDHLHGGAGNDILLGGDGNDSLAGKEGIDILRGNSGDDLFVFTADDFDAHDGLPEVRYDGGVGTDTIRFDGKEETLDLTELTDNAITGVEVVNLNASGAVLELGVADVLAMSDTNTLRVDGNDADQVISLNQGWEPPQQVEIGDQLYHEYSSQGATLLVDVDIDANVS